METEPNAKEKWALVENVVEAVDQILTATSRGGRKAKNSIENQETKVLAPNRKAELYLKPPYRQVKTTATKASSELPVAMRAMLAIKTAAVKGEYHQAPIDRVAHGPKVVRVQDPEAHQCRDLDPAQKADRAPVQDLEIDPVQNRHPGRDLTLGLHRVRVHGREVVRDQNRGPGAVHVQDLVLDQSQKLDHAPDLGQGPDLNQNRHLDLNQGLGRSLDLNQGLDRSQGLGLSHSRDPNLGLDLSPNRDLNLSQNQDPDLNHGPNRHLGLDPDLIRCLRVGLSKILKFSLYVY